MQRPSEAAKEITSQNMNFTAINDEDDVYSYDCDDNITTEKLIEKLARMKQKQVIGKQEKQQLTTELREVREQLAQALAAEQAAVEIARQETARVLQLQQTLETAEQARLTRETEIASQQLAAQEQQLQRDIEAERLAGIERQATLTRAEQAQAAMATQVQANTALLQQFMTQTQTETQQLRNQIATNNERTQGRVQALINWANAHTHHINGRCDGSSVKTTFNG